MPSNFIFANFKYLVMSLKINPYKKTNYYLFKTMTNSEMDILLILLLLLIIITNYYYNVVAPFSTTPNNFAPNKDFCLWTCVCRRTAEKTNQGECLLILISFHLFFYCLFLYYYSGCIKCLKSHFHHRHFHNSMLFNTIIWEMVGIIIIYSK